MVFLLVSPFFVSPLVNSNIPGTPLPLLYKGAIGGLKAGGARIGVQVCVFLDVRKIKKNY